MRPLLFPQEGASKVIDALLYAVRDGIRAARIGFDMATAEIMDDDHPSPRCGQFFLSIHDGAARGDADNQLNEWYEFSTTLTMRATIAMDRLGDQLMYRNLIRSQARKEGFHARLEQVKTLLHMNWGFVVLTNQTPPSANDNLASWATGLEVYGFCEPMRFLNVESAKVVGGEWFAADPESEEVGVKATIKFGRCRRMQPQTQANGPFQ